MRALLCQSCGDKWKLHPEDKRSGITSVKVRILLSSDDVFGTGDKECRCDLCDKSIPGGSVIWYVAAFKPESNYAERDRTSWEQFGKLVSEEEFKAITTLTR
jgi:hypothetical protein